jgi:hypothetical protein
MPTNTTKSTNGRLAKAVRVDPYTEIGVSGLGRYGPRSTLETEEFLRDLQGQRGIKTYREMQDNSPVVSGMLHAARMSMRQIEWRVEPADEEESRAVEAAELVETSLEDMSMPWHEVLGEIMSMLGYGFSVHEIVYKLRRGEHRNPGKASRYTDGLIGWRKMPLRSQDTLYEWGFDDEGGIQAFYQQAPPDWNVIEIPIKKMLLFRPEAYKNNPEGRSVLRAAYRPWYFGKHIEDIEGIGVERDLAGYPVVRIPDGDGNPNASQWRDVARRIKRDEQEGALLPSNRDEHGEHLYSIELLTSGGERSFDTTAILERIDRRIAMTILADFLFIGQANVGSHSLVSSRTSFFAMSLDGWATSIEDIFNRHAIPRLMALNGFELENCPKLAHGDIEKPDIAVWADALQKFGNAGLNLAGDPNVEQWVRQVFGFPELSEEDVEMLQEEREREKAEGERVSREEFEGMKNEMLQSRQGRNNREEEGNAG